jgi:hypothetical protein
VAEQMRMIFLGVQSCHGFGVLHDASHSTNSQAL